MIQGLSVTNRTPIRLFGRLMAVVVLAAFIALSFNCFACDSVSVSVPLTGNGHLHDSGKAHHQSNPDHGRQHDTSSSDCCSIPMSMVSNSPESIYKAAEPLPSSTYFVTIISASTLALSATERFFDYDPPEELSYMFISGSTISQRAPPMSI